MDYKGDYFPEERDERESKTYRVVGKAFKIFIYSVSLLVYLIIFFRIIISCDSELVEKVIFSQTTQTAAQANENFEVYRINTKEYMNYDGTIQLKTIVYAEETHELEMGVRYNSKITDGDTESPFVYLLKNKDGEICPAVSFYHTDKNNYGYVRVSFSDVDLNLALNDLNAEYDLDQDNNKVYKEERAENEFTLFIYKKTTGELIDKLIIYNNSTTYTKYDYKP